MIYSVQQIKFEFFQYIKEFGTNFSDWFVGISADPKKDLFDKHFVDKEKDIWLHKQAVSLTACKTIQKYFLQNLNTDGEILTEEQEDMVNVYLFKKSVDTIPSKD